MDDYNINLLAESIIVENYKNITFQNAFISLVSISTWVTETSPTLLDHILTNITSNDITPVVLQCDISNHFPTMHISKLINS